LRTVLLSIQALLTAAEPDDPQDAVVAEQVRKMRSQTASLLAILAALLVQCRVTLRFLKLTPTLRLL
jgi:ubiquitin-conjugating enzyme (huntingtin interacting protein 2)